MLSRRGFLFGAGATLAVIRTPGLIMPIKQIETHAIELLPYVGLRAEALPPGQYISRIVASDFGPDNILRIIFDTQGMNIKHVISLDD